MMSCSPSVRNLEALLFPVAAYMAVDIAVAAHQVGVRPLIQTDIVIHS